MQRHMPNLYSILQNAQLYMIEHGHSKHIVQYVGDIHICVDIYLEGKSIFSTPLPNPMRISPYLICLGENPES